MKETEFEIGQCSASRLGRFFLCDPPLPDLYTLKGMPNVSLELVSAF